MISLFSKIINGQFGISHDLTQQPSTQRPLAMYGNRGAPSVWMVVDCMATTLSRKEESVAFNDFDQLFGVESRESFAHTATRTVETATSSLIVSPRSRRSSM